MKSEIIFGLILLSSAMIELSNTYHNIFIVFLMVATVVPTIFVIARELIKRFSYNH